MVNIQRTRPAITEAIELLGKKWVMRILWELRGEPLTFRGLQSACGGVSPTILNARLKELISCQLVHKAELQGYALTALSQELLQLYEPLKAWATKWQSSL
jgi:DNA-binding HxlR family transcriptional regulator